MSWIGLRGRERVVEVFNRRRTRSDLRFRKIHYFTNCLESAFEVSKVIDQETSWGNCPGKWYWGMVSGSVSQGEQRRRDLEIFKG